MRILSSRFDVIVTAIEQQTHLLSMPSRHKCHLEKEEVKAEEKVEAEARTEEEEVAQQIQM